jgi:hypothetical protein
MKAIIISLSFIVVFSLVINAQITDYFLLDFEHLPTIQQHLTIDSISNPDNSWEIGKPNKSFFTEALSLPNAIVTDTINSYPTNDSSVFIITHYANYGFVYGHTAVLNGQYKVDCDSLNDFGRIEFSPDNGISWIDLIHDTINPPPIWGSEKPLLTGISNWTFFSVDLAHMGFEYELGDTVFFRFTFLSDEIENNRNGLMFDDISFGDFVEGIKLSDINDFNSKIFPNPSNQQITIEFDNKDMDEYNLQIVDINGKVILKKERLKQNQINIDLVGFLPGVYFYKIIGTHTHISSQNKFIVK